MSSFGFIFQRFMQFSILYILLVFIAYDAASPIANFTDNEPPVLIANSWQEFLLEQEQRRIKKDTSDGNNSTESSKSEAPTATASAPSQSSEPGSPSGSNNATEAKNDGSQQGNDSSVLGDLKIKVTLENGDEVEMEYVCQPEPNPCPKLKHYEMYPIEPEEDFYPSWSYHGFHHPMEWPDVSIDFFEEPPVKELNETENYRIRKHGSAMHLCTDKVTNDLVKCKEAMKNECINKMPSPINILRKETVLDESLSEFEFTSYNLYFGFEMISETDGSQLLFVKLLEDGKKPGIRGGSLQPNVELFLDRISIKIGLDEFKGSEHTLDGQYFGMELQFFFTADDLPYWQVLSRYKTFEEDDSRIGNQLHVISVFVKVAPDGKKPDEGRKFMAGKSMEILSLAAEQFWAATNENHYSVLRVSRKLVSLKDFFSEPEAGVYYTYQGSLTHPPCLTHVGWTVFEKPLWIPYYIWRRFAYVHAEYSDLRFLAGNTRPQLRIQVMADMDIYTEMKASEGQGELLQSDLDEAAENTRQLAPIYSDDEDDKDEGGTGSGAEGSGGSTGNSTSNSSSGSTTNSTNATTNNTSNGTSNSTTNSTSSSAPRVTRSSSSNSTTNSTTNSTESSAKSGTTQGTTNSTSPTASNSTSESGGTEKHRQGKVPELFVIRDYIDYQKYFSKRVRRSKSMQGDAKKRKNEFDYYDSDASGIYHSYSSYRMLIIAPLIIFITK